MIEGESFRRMMRLPVKKQAPFPVPAGLEDTVWVELSLVCVVQYMMRTEGGGMRQPVFQGFRSDKLPRECTVR